MAEKITPEMIKQAQRASGIGFFNQLLAGPPVDNKPMTTERAAVLLKRAHGFLAARDKRVMRVYNALAKA
jgi:hypothetical protein